MKWIGPYCKTQQNGYIFISINDTLLYFAALRPSPNAVKPFYDNEF